MALHLGPAARRAQFAHDFVLPAGLGTKLRSRYQTEDLGPAKRGLRQWLRIHALAPGLIAMPSVSVGLLWRDFVRSSGYADYAKHAYGRSDPGLDELSGEVGLAAAFAMACRDEASARWTTKMPVLFVADEVLDLPDTPRWQLTCGATDCAVTAGTRCIHHVLVPNIPEALPHQEPEHRGRPQAPLGGFGDYQSTGDWAAGGTAGG